MNVATKKEWLASLREEPHKHDRMVFIPRLIVVLILVAGIALWAGRVFAEPIGKAEAGGITITVYSEKCALTDQVSNLSNRATWEEKGKVNEGCAGLDPNLGIVRFYFDDKTVVAVPVQMFVKVTSI